MSQNYQILTGNEACVHGAMAAGMRFFAGYPITPATEIAELASQMLPIQGGKYMQMEDELASIAAVIGASVAGSKAMTATSGPGFSLMQENLSYGMIAEIPCVLVDVMRQGPCQGVATVPAQGDFMQARWGTHGDHPAVVLVPNSVAEVFSETIRAFNLSELLRTPVILLSDATLAHMSEKVLIPESQDLHIMERPQPECDPKDYIPFCHENHSVPPMASFGSGYRWFVSGIVHDNTGFPITNNPSAIHSTMDHLLGKIRDNLEEIESYEEYKLEDAEILILSAGLVSRSVKDAIDQARAMGIKVGLFRPITLWPFPSKRFWEQCNKVKTIMTCEMNEGQLAEIARQYCGSQQGFSAITQNDGTLIRSETILNKIQEVYQYESACL